MALADRANAWIADKAPWALNKVEGKQAEVQEICALGVNLFRQLVIFLKPVLPNLAAAAEQFLNVAPLSWDDHATLLANHKLNAFTPLMTRIEPAKIDAMIEASRKIWPPPKPLFQLATANWPRHHWPPRSTSTPLPRWTCVSP